MREWFVWATGALVRIGLDAIGIPIVGDWIVHLCVTLSDFTSAVAGELWEAANWLDDLEDRIREILSWSAIRSYIRSWLSGIESAIAWFGDWWSQIGSRIDTWWLGTISTVQGWIDAATQGFDQLKAAWDNFWSTTLPDIFSQFELFRANWSQFWSITFPTLVSFTWLTTWWADRVNDVQELIDSAFTLRDSLWAGWQDMRDDVLEFFADPLKWLYDRLEDFMDRYW